MIIGVVRFPGSNCDDDAVYAVNHVLGHALGHAPGRGLEASGAVGRILWHKDVELGPVDALIIPGGFSYGDYLRCGAMAAHSPIMAAVKRFADAGGPVLGICNGFQILCEAGLLEGALTRNQGLKFVCKDVYCVVEGRPTPFTAAIPAGRHVRMSIAHAEGRYSHPEVSELEARGQVVFRYCTAGGEVTAEANPNGSENNIAGVCNQSGNVVGLMPHPERAVEDLLGRGGNEGRTLLESVLAHHRGGPGRLGAGATATTTGAHGRQ